MNIDPTIPHGLIALVWFGGLGIVALVIVQRSRVKARARARSMANHPAGRGR